LGIALLVIWVISLFLSKVGRAATSAATVHLLDRCKHRLGEMTGLVHTAQF
jgi:hypothetical protein